MSNSKISMSPNPLVRFLKKEPKDFTREDLVRTSSTIAKRMTFASLISIIAVGAVA